MEEVEYLRAGNTLITSTRIEIAGQTFAVRNIGSVKVTQPSTPLITCLVGCGFLIYGFTSFAERFLAIVFGVGLIAYAVQQIRTRRLVLVSGGGEVIAMTGTNGKSIEAVRAAIANAIAGR